MDIVTLSFLLLGAVGAGGVVLHYAGYIPRPYRDRLERTETTLAANLQALPTAIGVEVENALNRVAAAQEAKYAQTAEDAVNSAKMSIVRSVGVDKAMQAKVSSALSEAILGPALPILRQFAPGLADMLEENPALVDVVIDNPLFKKYIAPRLSAYLGKGGGSVSERNPFLME